MKARTRIAIVLTMIAALLASTPILGAQEPDAPADRPDESPLFTPEERVGEWTAQRAMFGMSELEPGALLALQSTEQGQLSLDTWGFL